MQAGSSPASPVVFAALSIFLGAFGLGRVCIVSKNIFNRLLIFKICKVLGSMIFGQSALS